MILVLKGGVICVLRTTSSLKKVLGGGKGIDHLLSIAASIAIFKIDS